VVEEPQPAAAGRRSRARAELHRQLKAVARLRAATLSLIAAVVLGAPVGVLAIRWATQDPVFVEFDGMDLPGWAAGAHHDEAYGSRWCIKECRFRERTWESSRGPDETNQVYATALRSNGWQPWTVPGCPAEGIDGFDSCWQRDEYVLDLWVRVPVCDVKPVRPTVGPTDQPGAGAGGPKTSASPVSPVAASAEPSGAPTTPPAASDPSCPGSVATLKVFNRIAFHGSQG
jgi:hypothetical protein